tara:strand:- start:1039 stop:1275 length:237 start_codon:yes stop_codon:yes gene_type:complete
MSTFRQLFSAQLNQNLAIIDRMTDQHVSEQKRRGMDADLHKPNKGVQGAGKNSKLGRKLNSAVPRGKVLRRLYKLERG